MRRLLLFARRPRLGKVKTRLCPPLDPAQALALYRAFLTDLLALSRFCAEDYRVEVWWDGPTEETDVAGLDLEGLVSCVQPDGDLGRRLTHAFAAQDAPAVAIGSDSPTLGRQTVDDAFRILSDSTPVVLKPSTDGGYVLLGLWRPHPGIFHDVPWGGPHVCDVTLERAREQDLDVELLAPGYDVDDAAGLRLLEADLSHAEIAARAPATSRAVRLLF